MLRYNEAIRAGMDAMAARADEAAADPARPVYHFAPPSGWMNDVNAPLFHRGDYHVFYQHNPFHTDARRGTHWGHAKSADLVHWERLPLAIWPSTELGETSCYSGTAGFNRGGQPVILYTSTKKWGQGRRALEPFEQWAAIGDDDLVSWTKYDGNPVLSLEKGGRPDFDWRWRDPFFFTEQGRAFMVLGATGVGLPIWESESGDLLHWTFRGMASEISQECPNLFRLGDRYALLTSPYTPVDYHVGDFDIDTYKFTPSVSGRMEPTRTFYGTNILFDPRGRCLLFGRLLRTIPGAPWNGCMALPRALTLGDDGRPRQAPVQEVMALRGDRHALPDATLDDETRVLDIRGDVLELRMTIERGTAAFCGLMARRSSDGREGVRIGWDGDSVFVGGIETPYTGMAANRGVIDLRVFLDKSVIEVFVDDGRRVASNFIDCGVDDLGLALFARGGGAAFRNVNIWEMGLRR